MATPGLLAHVLVSPYCDHLPLYRQSLTPPTAAFIYAPDRRGARPAKHL